MFTSHWITAFFLHLDAVFRRPLEQAEFIQLCELLDDRKKYCNIQNMEIEKETKLGCDWDPAMRVFRWGKILMR